METTEKLIKEIKREMGEIGIQIVKQTNNDNFLLGQYSGMDKVLKMVEKMEEEFFDVEAEAERFLQFRKERNQRED